MNMTNVNLLIRPEETQQDVIAELCDDCAIGPNEHFAFSAIMIPDKENIDYYKLKINCLIPAEENPYTIAQLIQGIFSQKLPTNKIRHIQPPLERWMEIFRPYLMHLITQVHPRYELLIPEREEMLSILYLTIVKLYNKGYYLHKTLLHKSFVNELNMECRKLKQRMLTDSLDAKIGTDDNGKSVSLLDQIIDIDSTEWARRCNTYTEDDYWQDMFERIKSAMLQDMSELQFDRILIQLKTQTVDRSTSYKLDKYRQIFNPDYIPRPNRKGKTKPRGGSKE